MMKERSQLYGGIISYIIYRLTYNMNADELLVFIKSHPVLMSWEIKCAEWQIKRYNANINRLEKACNGLCDRLNRNYKIIMTSIEGDRKKTAGL